MAKQPNILVIWGDDIGISNISAYSDGLMGYRTPNIDRIANEGMRFTDCYGQQSCTAGRAAFITGQSPYRTGLTKVGVPGLDIGLQAEDATIIPLPGGTDPNIPVEVSLRLGKPTVDESNPMLTLPVVFAPVLKTQWTILGDENHALLANGGTVTPPVPVLRPSGFDWVAKRGIASLIVIGLLTEEQEFLLYNSILTAASAANSAVVVLEIDFKNV